MVERGIQFDYPAISVDGVDLLLVTHEHLDHNGVEAISGEPVTLRSTAGRLESPIGEVVAVGPGEVTKDGKTLSMPVQVGDLILMDKYGAQEVTLDDEEYVIVKADDIIAILN